MTLLQTVKSLIEQRLKLAMCAAAEDIFTVMERILTDYEHHAYCSKQERAVLDMVLNAHINHSAGFLQPPVCTEELSTEPQERSSRLVLEEPGPPPPRRLIQEEPGPPPRRLVQEEPGPPPRRLVQEEPEPPHVKEEQKDILQTQRPEETAESPITFLTVKLEEEDGDENGETEPLASTSTDHVKMRADVEYCGTSLPTRDDRLLSPHRSESDTEDSDEWEEYREGQSALLNTLESHQTQLAEGQRLPSNNELCQNLNSSQHAVFVSHRRKDDLSCAVCGEHFSHVSYLKQHMTSHTRDFTCTVCRKSFSLKSTLINHMTVHSGDKPFTCTVCEQSFKKKYDLKVHMRIHTGERPFTCVVCERSFNRRQHLKGHMKTHM